MSDDTLGAIQGPQITVELERYLSAVSTSLAKQATVAGVRAYMRVVQQQAIAAAPPSFRTPKAYRGKTTADGDGGARGTLRSAGIGNMLEAGMRAHWAPVDDKTDQTLGLQSPGLRVWLAANAPEVLKAIGERPFLYMQARRPTPWVIPSQVAADARGSKAFEDAAFSTIEKVK